jgi:hypothetical protein
MKHEKNYRDLRQKIEGLQNDLDNRANRALNQFDDWSGEGAGGAAALHLGKSEAYREAAKDIEKLLTDQDIEERAASDLISRASILKQKLEKVAKEFRQTSENGEIDNTRKEIYQNIAHSYESALNSLYEIFPEVRPELQGGQQ